MCFTLHTVLSVNVCFTMCTERVCGWCCEATMSDGILGWTVASWVSSSYGIMGLLTSRLWSHVSECVYQWVYLRSPEHS